jgi:hypothetical protein
LNGRKEHIEGRSLRFQVVLKSFSPVSIAGAGPRVLVLKGNTVSPQACMVPSSSVNEEWYTYGAIKDANIIPL